MADVSTSSDRRRFVVVGLARSGTTVLQRILSGHPQITMTWAEVQVAPFFAPGIGAWTFGNESFEERARAFPALFDAMAGLHATAATRAQGMKIAIDRHDTAVAFANAVREYLPDLRVVLVVRDDLVALCGSLERARATETWHHWADEPTEDVTVMIDPMAFTDRARDALDAVEQLRSLADDRPLFEVGYERDILGHSDWSDLFAFLGVDAVPITWSTPTKSAPAADHYVTAHDELARIAASLPRPTRAAERDRARAALVASARTEHPYQVLGRAEEWLRRGDRALAGTLAGEVAARTGIDIATRARTRLLVEFAALDSAGPEVATASGADIATWFPDRAAAETLLEVAETALSCGAPDTAEQLADRVLARDPMPKADVTAWAFTVLERSWTALEDLRRAADRCRAYAARYEHDAAFQVLAAIVARAQGRPDAANERLRRALELDPLFVRAHELLE